MPWLRLQHPGDRMPSLLKKRSEWFWRMGMIHLLTVWWAVSPSVNNSYLFGTWPILGNFYATFVLRPSIGDSVLTSIEMIRGCVVGYVMAYVITELTLALDDSLIRSEAGSKVLLGVLTFLSMVFGVGVEIMELAFVPAVAHDVAWDLTVDLAGAVAFALAYEATVER